MDKNNVYSSAKILNSGNDVENYQLGTFVQNQGQEDNAPASNTKLVVNHRDTSGNFDPLVDEIKGISAQINQINQKITNLENGGMNSKEIDKQVIQAIKDLKHYANFF